MNRQAFRFGRLGAHDRAALDRIAKPAMAIDAETRPRTLDDTIDYRSHHLEKYQDSALAQRYRAKVAWIGSLEKEKAQGSSGLAEAVAHGYHKLLAYKDEYEVGRLYGDPEFQKALASQFDSVKRIEFYLAPPLLARRNKTTGEPRKMRFGSWMLPVFRVLAKGKRLRGTRWDLFGYTSERKLERRMIADYEALLDTIAARLSRETHGVAVALANLPEDIKGFGHVKHANYLKAKKREAELLAALNEPSPLRQAAE